MPKVILLSLLATTLALPLVGCGVSDDFQAGNRLVVTSLTDSNDHSVPIFNAVVKTDDSGKDGDPATVDTDGSQGDHFPDDGEKVLEPLSDDLAKVGLKNVTRLGVDPGVPLTVYRVDVTYRDGNGKTRDFAPRKSYDVSFAIDPDGTGDLTFVIVPWDMKANGLEWYFLFGTSEELAVVRQWTAVVDVYARDQLNSDDVHAQGKMSIRFINPMVETVGTGTTP
ncbi:MAG: hypothetical protein HZB55_18290 [Deltaproteobacteria bacterium]|nr:hypothetical protein [Deltaproteobacteria bacterium]